MDGLAAMLGVSTDVAKAYLDACGGDAEQAAMRWFGHVEVVGELRAFWESLGGFGDDPYAGDDGDGGADGGGGGTAEEGGGKGEEDEESGGAGGAGAGAGAGAGEGGGSGGGEATAAEAAKHDARQEAIGKVLARPRRLLAELQNLKRGSKLRLEVETAGDAMDRWLIKLRPRHFPKDTPLHGDMLRLPTEWPGGVDHILLEMLFPRGYPMDPPFVRVVYPRFAWHTGHVNWGGSVCLETLVNTGTDSGYRSSLTVETLLIMVIFNMTSDTAGTVVKNGRLDFTREREFDRLDYSIEDGIENFRRIMGDHGWDRQQEAHAASTRGEARPASWGDLKADIASRGAGAVSTSFK